MGILRNFPAILVVLFAAGQANAQVSIPQLQCNHATPHALTDAAPCVWMENRGRTADTNEQISVTTTCTWKYYYDAAVGEDNMPESFNLLITKLRTRNIYADKCRKGPHLKLWKGKPGDLRPAADNLPKHIGKICAIPATNPIQTDAYLASAAYPMQIDILGSRDGLDADGNVQKFAFAGIVCVGPIPASYTLD